MSCSCCCEDFGSRGDALPVCCQYCEFTVCKECQKTYVLGSPSDMHCMSCKKEWSDEHVYGHFTKSFIHGDLKNHRETILMDAQKALLPTTQLAVVKYKRMMWLLRNFDEIVRKNYDIDTKKYAITKEARPYTRCMATLVHVESMCKKARESPITLDLLEIYTFPDKYRGQRLRNLVRRVDLSQKICSSDLRDGVMPELAALMPDPSDLIDLKQVFDNIMDLHTALGREIRDDEEVIHECVKTMIEDIKESDGHIDDHLAKTTTYLLDHVTKYDEQRIELDAQKEFPRAYDQRTAFNQSQGRYLMEHELKAPKEKHVWTWPCPCDECKGFLDTKHVCGVCEKKYCRDCLAEKTKGHVCDEATRDTIKLLKRDSKPCPKCSCVIHKISGCDQMWCPDCKTAFSWKSGEIEIKLIHNPHYYQYLRNTQGHVPRNPDDVRCDDLNNEQLLDRWQWQRDRTMAHPTYGKMWRALIHANRVWKNQWRTDRNDEKLLLMRVKYMIGETNADEWKRRLQMQQKATRKSMEITNIIDTFVQLGCDIIRDEDPDGFAHLDEKVERYEKLVEYFTSSFRDVSKRYSCVAPSFMGAFLLETKKYT